MDGVFFFLNLKVIAALQQTGVCIGERVVNGILLFDDSLEERLGQSLYGLIGWIEQNQTIFFRERRHELAERGDHRILGCIRGAYSLEKRWSKISRAEMLA